MRLVLSKNIKRLRKIKRLKQVDVANAAGIGLSTYNAIEKGHSWPQEANLDAISKVLGANPIDLFRAESQKHPSMEEIVLAITAVLSDPDFSLTALPPLRVLLEHARSRKKD